MTTREKWTTAAAEVVGREVGEAVPLARRRQGSGLYVAAGAAVFAVFVFLHEFGVIPGPSILVYFVGALPMAVLFQLANDPVFAVLTPTGIVVTGSSRWVPRPTPPVLGPLDPAAVSGPSGLLGNSYDIGSVRHQVGWQHKGRFEQMLAVARSDHAAH